VQFLALDVWGGSVSQVQGFVSAAGISYPALRNAGSVTNLYGGGYEYVYVVGGDGRVIYRNLGGWNTTGVQAAVDAGLEDLEATDVPDRERAGIRLESPAPNPFNPRTSITIDLPEGQDRVSLTIFDTKGRVVRRLLDDVSLSAGRTPVVWDGTDDRGRTLPSGVYHFRLVGSTATSVQKGVLLR